MNKSTSRPGGKLELTHEVPIAGQVTAQFSVQEQVLFYFYYYYFFNLCFIL